MNTAPLVPPDPRIVILLGVPFHDVTMQETLERMDALIRRGIPCYLATANLDFAAQASRDVELQRILFESELVLCDGTPLVWASRWLGAPLRERVAGADLMPHLFAHAAEKGHRLFFLGSTDEVLAAALAKCRVQYPHLNVCGTYSPSYATLLDLDHQGIRKRIREAQPDILLVAFGCPKQEKWIYMNYQRLGVPVSMGIGASLDFVAGKFRRAPVWMRVSGLEWLFRLLQEPKRLFSRYYIDLLFFVRSLQNQRRLLRSANAAPASASRADLPFEPGLVQLNWRGRIDAQAVAAGTVAPVTPEPGKPNVVLDCSAVTFVDSTGLGLFIKTFRACKQAGGTLVVLNPSEVLERMFQVLQLARLIPVARNVAEARGLLPLDVPVAAGLSQDATELTLTLIPPGDITAATAPALRSRLQSEWEQASQATCLQLDLRHASFMDSSGLGWLIHALKLTRNRPGSTLKILNPAPNVRNVIKLANLQAALGLSAP